MENPSNINEIDGDFVVDYCKEQGAEAVAWLKEIYNRPPKPDKNKVLREISFIEVRNEFARKYFSHLVPVGKGNDKKSMRERLAEL